MKTFFKIGAAVLALSASTAFAQTGNGSDVSGGTVSATVGGVFVPAPGNAGGGTSGGPTVTLPASTPVTVPPAPPSPGGTAVNNVISGSPVAVAAFTTTLTTAGVPSEAAAGVASALTSLSSGTAGGVAAAVTSWNAAVSNLTAPQLAALISSPAGRAAFVTILRANLAAFRAGISS